MTSVFRVECQCGAMTFCQARATLPHACAFCRRALPDGTAARLRALRIGRGLSTRAVAAHLGLGRTTAYEWEAARRPIPADRRSALAALLQVSPELLEGAHPAPALMEEPPMAPEYAAARTSPPESSSAANDTSPPPPPARRSVRFTIELTCLLCGRDLGSLESNAWPTCRQVVLRQAGVPPAQLADWRRLRCAVCGGAAMPTEVTCRLVRNEAPMDWAAERPRRGRPPKWLVAQRADGSSAA